MKPIFRIQFILALLFALPHHAKAQSRFSGSFGIGLDFYKPRNMQGFEHVYKPQAGFILTSELGFFIADAHELLLRCGADHAKYTIDYTWITTSSTPDPAIPYKTIHHHKQLNVGIGYNYYFLLLQRISLCLATGADYTIADNTGEESTMGDNSMRQTTYYNEEFASARLGIGSQFNFTQRYGVRIMPEVRVFYEPLDFFSGRYSSSFNFTVSLCFR